MESLEEANISNSMPSSENAYGLKPKQNQIAVLKKAAAPPVSTAEAVMQVHFIYRVLGLHMPKKNKVLYIMWSILVNGLVTICLPLSFTLSYLQVSEGDFDISNMLTSMQVVCNIYSCAIKTTIMAFVLSDLRGSKTVLAKLDERCRDPEEIVELHRLVRLSRRLVYCIGFVYFIYPLSTCAIAVMNGVAPYSIFIPYIHWRRSNREFILASTIEFCMLLGVITQHLGSDASAAVYVCVLRTHMKTLLIRIRKLGASETMSLDENLEELKLCIKDHKNLLEVYRIVSLVISKTIFVQFLVTGVILAITLVNSLVFTTSLSKQIPCIILIFGVLVEVGPLCYYSQRLINDNEILSTELFHSQWIGQNVRYRKMLLFFMHHVQQPMEFSAGKILPINLSSVLSIVKFSLSLYTFINKMGIKEKFNAK